MTETVAVSAMARVVLEDIISTLQLANEDAARLEMSDSTKSVVMINHSANAEK